MGAARRGAELIVTLSNDSWFAAGPGPRLHLVGAAFLSIEIRRPQLRATNTGISAVIAPTGEVLDTLGMDQRGTLVATVRPEIPVTTLMVVWGDWLGPTALGTGLVLFATALAGRPRVEETGAAERERAVAVYDKGIDAGGSPRGIGVPEPERDHGVLQPRLFITTATSGMRWLSKREPYQRGCGSGG